MLTRYSTWLEKIYQWSSTSEHMFLSRELNALITRDLVARSHNWQLDRFYNSRCAHNVDVD